MTTVLQMLLDGITNGAVLGAVAAGFAVIYRGGKVFNVAQGEQVMVAGYLVVTLYGAGMSLAVSLLIGAATMIALGLMVANVVIRPLIGKSIHASFIASVGLLLVFQGMTAVVFGFEPKAFPAVFGAGEHTVGSLVVRERAVLGALVVFAATFALAAFFRYTNRGRVMTAVAEDQRVAMSLGIDVGRSMSVAWALSGVFALLAAVVYVGGRNVGPEVAAIGLVALPVVLLAGLESIAGVIVGGVLIGIGQQAAAIWLDQYVRGGASLALPFVAMLIILVLRPTGLFGWRRVERV